MHAGGVSIATISTYTDTSPRQIYRIINRFLMTGKVLTATQQRKMTTYEADVINHRRARFSGCDESITTGKAGPGKARRHRHQPSPACEREADSDTGIAVTRARCGDHRDCHPRKRLRCTNMKRRKSRVAAAGGNTSVVAAAAAGLIPPLLGAPLHSFVRSRLARGGSRGSLPRSAAWDKLENRHSGHISAKEVKRRVGCAPQGQDMRSQPFKVCFETEQTVAHRQHGEEEEELLISCSPPTPATSSLHTTKTVHIIASAYIPLLGVVSIVDILPFFAHLVRLDVDLARMQRHHRALCTSTNPVHQGRIGAAAAAA
ncbi:hypothetical protein B0H14DRAFT_3133143 [Mycena olivaceomarginata]|nr:hypothetical protein B0H14DRAFT_3133143 [Mycena olivaceomarginata]